MKLFRVQSSAVYCYFLRLRPNKLPLTDATDGWFHTLFASSRYFLPLRSKYSALCPILRSSLNNYTAMLHTQTNDKVKR